MKTVLILAMSLGLSALVHAESNTSTSASHANKFLGQRPYAEVPKASQMNSNDSEWQGAGLVSDRLPDESSVAEKAVGHQKQMRLHFIGKRPYGDLHVGE